MPDAVQNDPAAARVDADAPLPVADRAPPVSEAPPADAGAAAAVADAAPPAEGAAAAAAAEPVATEAAATEGKDAVKTVADTPSLMEEVADKPAGEKPEEKPAAEASADGEKPKEGAAAEEPKAADGEKPVAEAAPPVDPAAPPPIEPIAYQEHYTLPERIVMDDAVRGEFHSTLDEFRRDAKGGVQKLLDLHDRQMQRYAQTVAQQQQDAFLATRATWRQEIQADEQLGGQHWDTVRQNVAAVRNELVSDAEPGSERYIREWKEFDDFTRITGAGDHKVLFRLLNNMAKKIGEPSAPRVSEIQPAPNGRAPGSRRALLYNNPTSPNNRN